MPAVLEPLSEGFTPYVRTLASALATAFDRRAETAISVWLDRLVEWNSRMDLTAARSPGELVDLMLADAIVMVRAITENARVVDIGTGAGGPGLAVAILRPDLRVTLVEPMQKRTTFLQTVIGELGVTNVEVVRTRGETLASQRPSFDVAMARATLPPRAWLELGARLVGKGGNIWVLLAREPAPGLDGWSIERDESYPWPHAERTRRAVCYARSQPSKSAR